MQQDNKKQLLFIILIVSIIILISSIYFLKRSSDNSKETSRSSKQRRSESVSSVASQPTLPPLPTSSEKPQQESKPLLSSNEIRKIWTKNTFCVLLSGENAQKILGSSTPLTPKYNFSEVSGARCTYSNSSGDEIYFELSPKTFLMVRAIDAAMRVPSTPVQVNNVNGVAKTISPTGVIYDLNIWGQDSNQLSVSGPDEKIVEQVASIVVSNLN